eukprot:TRINITY_DN12548_c0_g1_i5.p1 TRINITY_DN12548_c0_g1~~TRINITY_DN12548_c0_g1_i5.p1  ORF type:complete len:135 (-),score=45.78 TRINITY_DN12548_c0_g1_i5:16-420(-)
MSKTEPNTGLELSRVLTKDVTETVLCKICKCLLDSPVECSECNAGFCKLCISTWKAKHNVCPNNCPNSTIRKAHIIVRNMLDQLEVKCENYDYGCKEAIRYEVLKKHQKECKYLSLIHICRCRRYAVCRSRWSP